jgi:hypothetical protein
MSKAGDLGAINCQVWVNEGGIANCAVEGVGESLEDHI